MSGFAVIFDQKEALSATDSACTSFVSAVAEFKCLEQPPQMVERPRCVAAKFNSGSALHQEIAEDAATGSWLLAAGTLIDSVQVDAQGRLQHLLTDYLQQGASVFERLDGHFALVIYDGRTEQLVVVADPFGILSLFWGQQDNRFFISTSALAVAQATHSPLSEFGARYFLVVGNVFGEMTLWRDVRRMRPATAVTISPAGVNKTSYWSLELDPAVGNLSLNQSVEQVIEVLNQASQHGLLREGKAWLSLTGGFDSRTLSAMMHQANIPFKTYCHGPPETDDVRIAALISEKMKWDYEYFPLPEEWGHQRAEWLWRTVGQSDAHLGVLKTSRIVREQTFKAQQYDLSLWGFGGEIYRGYYWKQEFFDVGTSSQVNYDRLFDYRLGPSLGYPILQNSSSWVKKVRGELETELRQIGEREPGWLNTAKLDAIGTHLEGTVHAGAHISAVLGLQRPFSPFYFKEGMQTVISINHKWRVYNRLFRLMLEKISPRLAAIKTADGGPALPMRVTNLYKFGPYWANEGKKMVWSGARKFLGVQLWNKNRNAGTSYPLEQWRLDTLAALQDKSLLDPAQMHSAALYDPDVLSSFLTAAAAPEFKYEALLSRVITLEMALRLTGTSV